MNKSDDETLTFKEMVGKFDVTPEPCGITNISNFSNPRYKGVNEVMIANRSRGSS